MGLNFFLYACGLVLPSVAGIASASFFFFKFPLTIIYLNFNYHIFQILSLVKKKLLVNNLLIFSIIL